MSTQTNRGLVLGLTAALVATFAFAPSASADRRSSLAGNLLIKDSDDIYIYPHLLTEYARLISFDLALSGVGGPSSDAVPNAGSATSTYGNALLIFGSEQAAFAVATHRSDFWGGVVPAYYLMGDMDQMSGVASTNTVAHPGPLYPVGATSGVTMLAPLQWVDLIGAMNMGGMPLGARLSIGHNRQTTATSSNDGDAIDATTATSVNLNVGTHLKGGGIETDVAADLGFGLQSYEFETTNASSLRTIDATGLNIAVTGRSYVPMAQGVDLGIVGLLYYRSLSGERKFDDDDNRDFNFDLSSFGLDVGAGPRYRLDDKFTISAYGTIGFRSEDEEPNDDVDFDEANRMLIGVPMLKIAGEYQLFDWMVLRTGAHYIYNFTFTDREIADGVDQSQGFTANSFRWVTGVGIMWEGLELNGTFNAPFLLNGPELIGGGNNGMFALLNVQYSF